MLHERRLAVPVEVGNRFAITVENYGGDTFYQLGNPDRGALNLPHLLFPDEGGPGQLRVGIGARPAGKPGGEAVQLPDALRAFP